MPPPSSQTVNYDALVSTTLQNYQTEIEDNIATANSLFYFIFREEDEGYEGESSLGREVQIQLRYELGQFDSYSGYDTLRKVPMDGVTSAFWQWRQAQIPIMISRMEERQNSGEHQMIKLVKEKTDQAVNGIYEGFSRSFLQGQGYNDPATAGQIETPYVSPNNASSFIDPLPLLVKKDPTTSTVIGNINQSTATWWRNQSMESTSANYAGFLKDLRRSYNNCSKGVGKAPNLHLCDQNVYEVYEAALASQNQYTQTKRADIPFDNIAFRGRPVTWDEFMPNWEDRVVGLVASKGSWVMLNTKFWKIKYDEQTNFMTTPFERPVGQDAKSSDILWYGASCVSNRRKHGVVWGIDTTLTA